MSKKISIILISIVIVISLGISIYIPIKNKMGEKDDTSIKYSTIKVDEKIGVIDQDNNMIINPQYDEIIIVNPHRAIFFCSNGENQKVVNSKNEEIFQKYDKVEPIQILNEKYEKNVLEYELDGKFGLLGITGDKVTEAKYEEITSMGYKESELLVKQDGKYGIIHENGNYKIKNKYDEILADEYYTEENEYKKSGYIVKTTTDEGYRYGYYDNEGMKVLNEEYNQITRLTQIKSNDIYLIAAKNGQYGVFINNSKIINTEYQAIEYNSDMQMFIVERTGKYGAMTIKGTKVLEPEYSELNIKGIYLYCIKDEVQKVFDENGKEINIPFDTVITAIANSKYFIRNDAGKFSIVNTNFEKITKQEYKYIEHAYNSYFIVTNEEDKVGVIDIEEKNVVKIEYDLIQQIKGKNIIQAIDFSSDKTDIYDSEFDLALEMINANIELLENGIRVYNEEQESFLDDNGKFITQ